mgnify:CR=1 FL=1
MEIDKKTVLDLCAHMFHQLDDNEEDIVNESYYQNNNYIIFECFPDEIN